MQGDDEVLGLGQRHARPVGVLLEVERRKVARLTADSLQEMLGLLGPGRVTGPEVVGAPQQSGGER
jgi:hypothetical protein